MAAKLKKHGSKQIATDIQIAAGMVTLALFSPDPSQEQQGQQQQPPAQQAPGPQQQQSAPPQQSGGDPSQQQQPGGPQLPPGIQSIVQVLQGANDPAAALAHVIFMCVSRVDQALQQKNIEIDDKVWIMGGGVLDRVMFEVMMVLNSIVHFQPAADPNFVHQVKSDVLDLMEDDDTNSKSMKLLHDKGLPIPKAPPDQGQMQQSGLAAPQSQGGQ